MSHVVSVEARIHDAAAVVAACRRLSLPEPVQGIARLYSGEATGLIVQLPGWVYPLVIDTLTGIVVYDNYDGRWGKKEELDRLVQRCSTEKCYLEARRKGLIVSEQTLQDGSIRLSLSEGQ
jgi:hypothetical protein